MTRDDTIIESSTILALVLSLGMLLGCEHWIAPVPSPAGSLDGVPPVKLASLCETDSRALFSDPRAPPAGNDLIESLAEEEDSPELS